jgi:hypothetical protein
MIRKQIYIERRQQLLLKRISQNRGVSEAEIIRQAIDKQLDSNTKELPSDLSAWDKAHQFMLHLQALGPVSNQPRRWTRDEIYEERLSRYDRHSN